MMNLNQTEIEVIRDVVRAAVSDAIQSLRDELKRDLEKSYTREVIDLKFTAQQDRLNEIEGKLKKQGNVLAHLWESAFGKAVIIANGFLVLYTLWQLLPH